MAIVKSLTKKNCKEIGAKYVGKGFFGGIDYSYRGMIFNQEKPRNGAVYIGLIITESSGSYVASEIFKQIYQGEIDRSYKTEFDLSELKSWMDNIADTMEEAEKRAQAPLSEEEKVLVYQEIESAEKQVEDVLEQVKKSFRWWESREDTDGLLYEIQRLEDLKPDINSLLETFKLEKEVLSQHLIRNIIHARLQYIQCSIENISEINNKHS